MSSEWDAPKSPITEPMDDEIAVDGVELDGVEQTMPGAPIPYGQVDQWKKVRNMGFVMNPVFSKGIAWFDGIPNEDNKATPQDLALYPMAACGEEDNWSEGYRKFVAEAFATTLGPEAAVDVTQRYADFIESIKSYQKTLRQDSFDVPEAEPLDDALSIALCIFALYFNSGMTIRQEVFGGQSTYEVRQPLLEWLNVSDQNPSVDLGKEIMEHIKPAQHAHFWRYIYQLVCRGLLPQAIWCLQNSGVEEIDVSCEKTLAQVIQVLSKYPQETGNVSFYFRQWHNSVVAAQRHLTQINDAPIQKGFTTLLDLLAGEEPAIMAVCVNWYDALVAQQQFVDPADGRLKDYFKASVARHPVDAFQIWEEGANHAFKGELLLAIETLEKCDSVIAAIVMNMCYDVGLLNQYGAANPAALPDYHLTNLALKCIGFEDLISVGINVVQKVRDLAPARQILSLLLPRLTYETKGEIDWALRTCKTNGLVEVEAEILQILAQNAIHKNDNLMGLSMFAQTGNLAALRHHCWNLFKKALIAERAIEGDDNLAAYIEDPASFGDVPAEVAECIAPYAVLTEYFSLRQSGQLDKSSQRLLSLFEFPLIPTEYLGLLIHQFINYVTPTPTHASFSSSQIMTLIAAFNKWDEAQGTEAFETGETLVKEMVDNSDDANDDWRKTYTINELVLSELRIARTGVATMSARDGVRR